ncbi:MAG: galactokinase [Kangiellaceae bacterium]|jgi:galactokinase
MLLPALSPKETNRMENAVFIQQFEQLFGTKPTVLSTSPGRVNIIGEHTDYNDGFVLPAALQFTTQILCAKRSDDIINARSVQYEGELESFNLSQMLTPGSLAWGNYLRAVVNEFKAANLSLGGCDLLITSNVPQGSGLSSSAALEVAFGGLLNHIFNNGLNEQQIALIGQAAENNFIDCQCGIMDQLISAKAKDHHAILIDCKDLSTRAVHIPENLALVVINSNYPRKLADSEYNQRRKACELAASTMQVGKLREANMNMLDAVKNQLDDVTYRRAKHIITENKRVLDAANAMENGNLTALYSIMQLAHLSLKNDFEITVAATDGLVDICNAALNGKGAARQTGGGFGGAVVCLCDLDDVETVILAVNKEYEARYSLHADIYVCEASEGLQVVDLP